MLPKDKKMIVKLQRRVSLLIILIFALFYYSLLEEEKTEFALYENSILHRENLEKDKIILKLKEKSHSVKKSVKIKKTNKKKELRVVDRNENLIDTLVKKNEIPTELQLENENREVQIVDTLK